MSRNREVAVRAARRGGTPDTQGSAEGGYLSWAAKRALAWIGLVVLEFGLAMQLKAKAGVDFERWPILGLALLGVATATIIIANGYPWMAVICLFSPEARRGEVFKKASLVRGEKRSRD